MATILLTGFPGFLGSELVERLLQRCPLDTTVACLIQSKFKELAKQRAAAIERRNVQRSGRIRLYEGDITLPDLGLGKDYAALTGKTLEIYHLAAVYDLAVKKRMGMLVNVKGTRHMLRFAENCSSLNRFHYVSTCYVSGRYAGEFSENDLQKGQTFNNFYEETKYLAELEVQKCMASGLPATVYRPSIVVGNSRTGATQKYDGPYFIIQWILRQPAYAIVPIIGDTNRCQVNLIPSDFLIDAISHLSSLELSRDKVYQLCSPDPPTVSELLAILEDATERKLVRVPLPKLIAKGALKYVPGVYRLMRIEPEAIEYFVHPTRYSCDHMLHDLKGTDIACPPFSSYARNLVKFMRRHPEISPAAMV